MVLLVEYRVEHLHLHLRRREESLGSTQSLHHLVRHRLVGDVVPCERLQYLQSASETVTHDLSILAAAAGQWLHTQVSDKVHSTDWS